MGIFMFPRFGNVCPELETDNHDAAPEIPPCAALYVPAYWCQGCLEQSRPTQEHEFLLVQCSSCSLNKAGTIKIGRF